MTTKSQSETPISRISKKGERERDREKSNQPTEKRLGKSKKREGICVFVFVGLYMTEKSNRKNKQLMAKERPGGRGDAPNSTFISFGFQKGEKKERGAFPNSDVKIQKENRKRK